MAIPSLVNIFSNFYHCLPCFSDEQEEESSKLVATSPEEQKEAASKMVDASIVNLSALQETLSRCKMDEMPLMIPVSPLQLPKASWRDDQLSDEEISI